MLLVLNLTEAWMMRARAAADTIKHATTGHALIPAATVEQASVDYQHARHQVDYWGEQL